MVRLDLARSGLGSPIQQGCCLILQHHPGSLFAVTLAQYLALLFLVARLLIVGQQKRRRPPPVIGHLRRVRHPPGTLPLGAAFNRPCIPDYIRAAVLSSLPAVLLLTLQGRILRKCERVTMGRILRKCVQDDSFIPGPDYRP